MNITSSTNLNDKQLNFITHNNHQFEGLRKTCNISSLPNKKMLKSKSTIRIKHKPNKPTPQSHHHQQNKLINGPNNMKTIVFFPIEVKNGSNEIGLLKELVNKKKQQIRSTHPQPIDLSTQRKKESQEYDQYDLVVKDILEEIRFKKMHQKKNRPIISPSRFASTSKNKFLKKCYLQSDQEPKIMKKLNKQPAFKFSQYYDGVYEKKITSYLMFLYKINYSNSIYVDLSLSKPSKNYKIKIEPGNNGRLIKSLLKRRFWLQITTDSEQASFVWSQNTIEHLHVRQHCIKRRQTKQQIQDLKRTRIYKRLKGSDEIVFNHKILKDNDIIEAQLYYSHSNYGLYCPYQKVVPQTITNHIPHNYFIGSKKILFMLMNWYYREVKGIDPFLIMPKTYHIRSGQVNNSAFKQFLELEGDKPDKVWIIKPGQNTNQGNGITVASLSEISRTIRRKQVHKNGQQKTYIIQQYVRPFLYHGRKFDIRHFLLITAVNGYVKGYWFKEGYIRTCSEEYDLDDLSNQFVHLTNDSIQKKSQCYGKYEAGNKISYSNFQRYLDSTYPHKKYSFENQILNKMKDITRDIMKASFSHLNPQKKSFNFELFGMDFLIDNKFKPYLIEVNANPCLQTSCPLLQRIIPIVTEHTLRIGLDPLLPPTQHYNQQSRYNLSDRMIETIKFELIFDEKYEGDGIRSRLKEVRELELGKTGELKADEQTFNNEGEQLSDMELD